MNCTLRLRMLDAYVDDELDAVTAAEMAGHLATCAGCATLHGQRVAMRTALRSSPLREAGAEGIAEVDPARNRARARPERAAPDAALVADAGARRVDGGHGHARRVVARASRTCWIRIPSWWSRGMSRR
jgi:anti-sigma factor RsiW